MYNIIGIFLIFTFLLICYALAIQNQNDHQIFLSDEEQLITITEKLIKPRILVCNIPWRKNIIEKYLIAQNIRYHSIMCDPAAVNTAIKDKYHDKISKSIYHYHMDCYEWILEHGWNDKPTVILDDDVILTIDFLPKLQRLIHKLSQIDPQWDILGFHHDNNNISRLQYVTKGLCKNNQMVNNIKGYVINKFSAIEKIKFLLYENIRVYTCIPQLIIV